MSAQPPDDDENRSKQSRSGNAENGASQIGRGFGFAARRLINSPDQSTPEAVADLSEPRQRMDHLEPPFAQPMDPHDLIGTVLDHRIQLLELLGQGGMSVVYKAKQLNMDRLVAVKTLHIHLQDNPHSKGRFQREINSLCKLNHPNIITMYDCIFNDNGQPFVIMDYLKGRDLSDMLEGNGPFDAPRAYKIFLQICDALAHAHRNGVIHRDLKPSNIMFLDDYEDLIKVVDFGLAKMAEENVSVTRTGQVEGTPTYMSPEQWRGETPDLRTDIYSLGAVMYETLTGSEVFIGRAAHELLHKHLNEQPRSFREANSGVSIPDKLERVVMKCLEKEPEDRYQSMGEVKSALQNVFGEGPAPTTRRFKTNEFILGVTSVALVGGVCLFCLGFIHKMQHHHETSPTAPANSNTLTPPAHETVPPTSHLAPALVPPVHTTHNTNSKEPKRAISNKPLDHKPQIIHHHHKPPHPEEHPPSKPKHESAKPAHSAGPNPWDKLRHDIQDK